MVSRVQWHMREGAQGRYRKGGRGSSQEPENGPTRAEGRFELLSTVPASTGYERSIPPFHTPGLTAALLQRPMRSLAQQR